MPLPKLMHPIFDLTIPSTKQKVKFRPFLVKEEKLLLMAKQGNEKDDIISVLKQIINNCDVESTLNVDTLALFDIEYLFLKLRAKSVNNIIDVQITDPEDEKDYKFSIDVDEIEIQVDPKHNNIIKLTEESGISMKYPSSQVFEKILNLKDMTEILFTMIKGCLDIYYDGDKIVNFKDHTDKEIDEFLEDMPTKVLKEFELFFETMPKMYHKIEYENSLGTKRVVELKTIEDFFSLG